MTETLKRDWLSRYGQGAMQMHMHLNPSDQLLAGGYREFQKGFPTVIQVEKIKSSFVAMKPQEETKQNVGGKITLHFNEEYTPKVHMVVDYYWWLRILAYAVAKAGNHEVPDPNDATKKIMFAPLDVTQLC